MKTITLEIILNKYDECYLDEDTDSHHIYFDKVFAPSEGMQLLETKLRETADMLKTDS